MICLEIIFKEKTIPNFLCLATLTLPNLPLPSYRPSSKSLIFIGFIFLYEEEDDIVSFKSLLSNF